jgi:DNA-binding PadR family transcriptional regulator
MPLDKALITGSTTMLILSLLTENDLYGYQMIEALRKKSNNVFALKAGTLYPLLHSLEQKELVTSYDDTVESTKVRRYYHLTKQGHKFLEEKTKEWKTFASAVNSVLGGESFAAV